MIGVLQLTTFGSEAARAGQVYRFGPGVRYEIGQAIACAFPQSGLESVVIAVPGAVVEVGGNDVWVQSAGCHLGSSTGCRELCSIFQSAHVKSAPMWTDPPARQDCRGPGAPRS